MNRRTRLGAAMALSMALTPVGASAQQPGYVGFLEHVSEAMGDVPQSGSALLDFAEGEIAWALDNVPHECYAGTWGRYLVIMERFRIAGWAWDNEEAATVSYITGGFDAQAEDYATSLQQSTADCVAL